MLQRRFDTMLAYEYRPIPKPSEVTTMGKHKKAKSKIPKRSRPLPPHLQAQLQSHFQQKQASERAAELDEDDWGDDDNDEDFDSSEFEMIDFGEEFEFNGSVLIDGVLVSGKALKGSRSELPRPEDFASLEEYYLYHVRSMLAEGVAQDEIDLDYVLPSFVEAMQFETEKEIRSSPEWQSTVDQVGLEKAEHMMRGIKPQVDVSRRESQKRARRNK